jgi:hypothetical protein
VQLRSVIPQPEFNKIISDSNNICSSKDLGGAGQASGVGCGLGIFLFVLGPILLGTTGNFALGFLSMVGIFVLAASMLFYSQANNKAENEMNQKLNAYCASVGSETYSVSFRPLIQDRVNNRRFGQNHYDTYTAQTAALVFQYTGNQPTGGEFPPVYQAGNMV